MATRETMFVTFDVTCDYEGRPSGPAVVDAMRVITVEARVLDGELSIIGGLFSTKFAHKSKTNAVEICFDGGLSIYVLWDLAHVLKALGIEATR
jgi:hypothetical protein